MCKHCRWGARPSLWCPHLRTLPRKQQWMCLEQWVGMAVACEVSASLNQASTKAFIDALRLSKPGAPESFQWGRALSRWLNVERGCCLPKLPRSPRKDSRKALRGAAALFGDFFRRLCHYDDYTRS
eukprot:222761-Amphidinium_carterae.1